MKNSAAKKILYNVVYAVIAIAVIAGAWAISAAAFGSEFILPSIGATLRAFEEVFKNSAFYVGLLGTLLRSMIGYAIALALFFVTFYLATCFDGLRRVLMLIVSVLRTLPAVAVTLILLIAVGGSNAPIVLGVIVIYPIIFSSATSAIVSVPSELKEICRLCGASRTRTFVTVYLPRLAAGLPENLATAFSYNVKAVVGAEILAQAAYSLGMLMKTAQISLEPALLMAFVIAAVVISVALELVIRYGLKLALRKYAE